MDVADNEIVFFDVETTGLSRTSDRIVQIAWILADRTGKISARESFIIKPEGYGIPSKAASVHGIDTETAFKSGRPAPYVLRKFASDASGAQFLVGHNIPFDIGILRADLRRHDISLPLKDKLHICTMRESTRWCRIPKVNGSPGFKWPRLDELHYHLFEEDFANAHDAMADVEATMRCFYELLRIGQIVLPEKQGSPKRQPVKPAPKSSRESDKSEDSAKPTTSTSREKGKAQRAAVWLTRRVQIECYRCGTKTEVTLNYGEHQVACSSCYAINRPHTF